VMSAEPYEVGPDTAVDVVAEHMAKHKQDCAVVIEHQKVIGVFTTIDALELLTVMLRENKQPSPAQPPQPPQSLAKAAGKKQK
jgi:predicted transcriptional regulator